MRPPTGARGRRARGGFTLIEVIGALVIFSAGVLMVMDLTNSLARQMNYAAALSEIVVRTQELVDSLSTLPLDSLNASTSTVTVGGRAYTEMIIVTPITELLYELHLSLTPNATGDGPSHSVVTYAAAEW